MEQRVQSAAAERSMLDRLRVGDETALGELYDHFGAFVFGLALRIIGDKQEAENVTQDVFVSVWEHAERLDGPRGSLRAYLGTLTHSRSVDAIRRDESRRQCEVPANPGGGEVTGLPVSDAGPRDPGATIDLSAAIDVGAGDDRATVAGAGTAQRVRAAVTMLPVAQREALELAYFKGHTYRQVAHALGIPEGTAKARLRLGLQHIAESLRPDPTGRQETSMDQTRGPWT